MSIFYKLPHNRLKLAKNSDLNFFSEFIIDFSKEMPFFYGLFTIMFAIILGVGAAFIRRFVSKFKNKVFNGKMMFIYQAHQAFSVWHKILPEIDNEVIKIVEK